MSELSKRQAKYLRKRQKRVLMVKELSMNQDGYSPQTAELHANAFLAPAGLLAFAGDREGYAVMKRMTDDYSQLIRGAVDEDFVAEQARYHLYACSLFAGERGFQQVADIMLQPVLAYMKETGLEPPELE